jgi:hypothetical protein
MTPLMTTTISSAANVNVIYFNNIPQTYTDLILVANASSTGGSPSANLYFNLDTSTSYSHTALYGTGSTTGSDGGGTISAVGAWFLDSNQRNFVAHIAGYSNTNIYKTILMRLSTGVFDRVWHRSALWNSKTAISSVVLSMNTSDNFTAGSTFTLYGIEPQSSSQAKATGGSSIYTDGTYWYHIFRQSGIFTPKQSLSNVDYLVVAGGGSGSDSYGGGGGGAGGLRSTVTATGGGGSLESKVSFSSGVPYTITIGAGGNMPGVIGGTGVTGSNSSISGSGFTTITSLGGGGGVGLSGGSGGGGRSTTGGGSSTGGSGQANQGYAGGNGASLVGGGGGGAGSAGGNGTGSTSGGNGGNGVAVAITGSSVYYAGGGGGGADLSGGNYLTRGSGGLGGGGQGGSGNTGYDASPGTAGTGGGGGGGGRDSGPSLYGKPGGSGIVILRYSV